jgi:putative ABC transport system substrate-binding protein
LRLLQDAASALGVQVSPAAIRGQGDIERAINTFATEPNGGIVSLPGPILQQHRQLIVLLAVRYRLPAVYSFRYYAAEGGLASYGPNDVDVYSRPASYVDRILKGEKPGDLPVQAPVRYELAVNLNAAKAIGLTVPSTLLNRADEVIK